MENKYKGREKEYMKEYNTNYYKNNKSKWIDYKDKDKYICVYRLINKNNKIVRIGSTGDGLKIRIANYMSERVFKGWGMHKWFNEFEISRVDYILMDTRLKAYQLEKLLIDKFKPELNVLQNYITEDINLDNINSLGDISDIEDLWEEWEGLEYYKNKYKAICNMDL